MPAFKGEADTVAVEADEGPGAKNRRPDAPDCGPRNV